MEFFRRVLCVRAAVTFFRDHMDHDRAVPVFYIFKCAEQGGQIVSVDGPHITDPQFLEEQTRHKKIFCRTFQLLDAGDNCAAAGKTVEQKF